MVKNCSNCRLTIEHALSSYVVPPECTMCDIVIVGKERMPSKWVPATNAPQNKEIIGGTEGTTNILKQYSDFGVQSEKIDTLVSRLYADNVRVGQWISVEEKLPDLCEPVIICRQKKGSYRVQFGFLDIHGWWVVYGTRCKTVTHWMPLPDLPKGTNQ